MRYSRILSFLYSLLALVTLTHCGIVVYPGQPGIVTNSSSKIDMEYLDEPGLFVYETVYDNRVGGQGVGAIVTKLHPNAKTYTSNIRTNADGTLYRTKLAYEGAELQMIAVPSLHQVHMQPNHKIVFLIEYPTSLDEVDDKNVAEQNLFKKQEINPGLTEKAFESKKFRWDLLRAGSLTLNGTLAYEVTGFEMNQMKFVPSQPVMIETNFFGSAIRTNLNAAIKSELKSFLETNFPKGYNGIVNIQVKGSTDPVALRIGVHTLKTLEASGVKVINDASETMLQDILTRFKANVKEGN